MSEENPSAELLAAIREIVVDEIRAVARSGLAAPDLAQVRGALAELLDDQVLDVEAAAAFLGLSVNTVYEYAGRGELPHRRVGRRLLFARSGLINWLGNGSDTGYP